MVIEHPPFIAWWSPGENPWFGLPDQMTVLCPRQHILLGGVILETHPWLLLLLGAVGVVFGGVGAASLGPTASVLLSAGFRMLALEPPIVAVAVWELRALGGVSARLCLMTTQCMSPPPAIRLNYVAELPV